jgi:hypothetical protein
MATLASFQCRAAWPSGRPSCSQIAYATALIRRSLSGIALPQGIDSAVRKRKFAPRQAFFRIERSVAIGRPWLCVRRLFLQAGHNHPQAEAMFPSRQALSYRRRARAFHRRELANELGSQTDEKWGSSTSRPPGSCKARAQCWLSQPPAALRLDCQRCSNFTPFSAGVQLKSARSISGSGRRRR